jgi:beta-barrel assembly-enhancing protease
LALQLLDSRPELPQIPPMKSAPKSIAYLLGRKTAPSLLKAQWIFHYLTGSESEKIGAEQQLGALLARSYEEKVSTQPNNRLEAIASQLTRPLRNKRRCFRVKLDHSPFPNALALPGGFIYCSEALLDQCGEDKGALAFVLAHEMAHIIHGDAAKRFLTRTVLSSITRAGTRRIHPLATNLLNQLVQKHYSRQQELRADRFASTLASAAGFDPRGGIRLLEQLASEPCSAHRAYFSTHPTAEERIKNLEDKLSGARG